MRGRGLAYGISGRSGRRVSEALAAEARARSLETLHWTCDNLGSRRGGASQTVAADLIEYLDGEIDARATVCRHCRRLLRDEEQEQRPIMYEIG